MKLYFFRHALAEDAGPGMTDHERALLPRGIERTKIAAQILAVLGVQPHRLFSSPLVRARQTADLLAVALKLDVVVSQEVGPGFNVAAVQALIADFGSDDDALFVGHEPDMSSVVSALIGGGDIMMKKGSLARVDVYAAQPLRGALVWLVAPRVFDTLED